MSFSSRLKGNDIPMQYINYSYCRNYFWFWHVYVLGGVHSLYKFSVRSWRHCGGDWYVCCASRDRDSDEPSRSVNLGMHYVYTCGYGMWKGAGPEGRETIHRSRRRWISSARTAVHYVCYYSSALTSCATSMADTNIDAIKKNYKYNFYLVIEVPDHVYVLG
jgi:hypothetical protein